MTGAASLVRHAEPRDAAVLGHVHVRAWQAAYRASMPDDFLDALDPVDRAATWASALAAPRSGSTRLVVCDGPGEAVGFAVVGPVRETDPTLDGLGELYAINLDPDVWGQGLGRELLSAATAELSRLGFV